MNIFEDKSNMKIEPNQSILLVVPPTLVDGRALVPVWAVAESFDAKVDWEEASNSVLIVTQQTSEPNTEESKTPQTHDESEMSESTPEKPDSETLSGKYNVETILDKKNIKRMQSLVYANDTVFYLDNNTLKAFDLRTITEFKNIETYNETNQKTYKDYLPICLAYNNFTDKVLMFGVFQKADDKLTEIFAVYVVGDNIELINTYDQNPLKNYTYEPRFCFFNADEVYCWDYNFIYRQGQIYSGITLFNLKYGSINKQHLGQDFSPEIKGLYNKCWGVK